MPEKNTPYRLLSLGDSYTIGEQVPEADRFPVQAAALLQKKQLDFAPPVIVATTGWTTDELQAGIRQAKGQGPFSFVTLLIGVNNQYRGRDTAEYRLQFRELLQTAIHFAQNLPRHVFVLSIPDWGVTPFAAKEEAGRTREVIAAQIDEFNGINAAEAAAAGAHYIEITQASRLALQDSSLLAPDGLHPSGKMYAEWARLLADGIAAELKG